MSGSTRHRVVSVPRRGFVVFLRSGGRYSNHVARNRFSPPKGIRCFSTRAGTGEPKGGITCFSPPKGIRCFSTLRLSTMLLLFYRQKCRVSVPRRGFVVFLLGYFPTVLRIERAFQSPEGDSLFFYQIVGCQGLRQHGSVSVPRRGFIVFLHE